METNSSSDFLRPALAAILAILILAAAVYAAYLYSQSRSGAIVLPGGVTYTGPTSQAAEKKVSPLPERKRFTAKPDVPWIKFSGQYHPYSFSYPETLTLVFFPDDDPLDTVAISWGDIPPQLNILLNLEFIDQRDPSYIDQPKIEYVRNWHKHFSGFSGVAKIEPFTNTSGLTGYKAIYINTADQTPNVDVFFEVTNEPNMMIHMANGILDPAIFDRMIDGLEWIPETATPAVNQ